jgi:K+-sensing histidine kinase KdpD
MNIYTRKQTWKIGLSITALIIIFTSLWYTNQIVSKIANEERVKAKLWADAVQRKAKLVKFTNELFVKLQTEERKKAELYALATKQLNNDLSDISFVLKVLQDNTTVPVILTDQNGKVTTSRNLDSSISNSQEALKKEVKLMSSMYEPVVIDYYKGQKNYLYYKDSRLFNDIKVVFDSLIKSFISDVINSTSLPVIYTDSSKTKIIDIGNIDPEKIKTPELLKQTIEKMTADNQPIEVDLGDNSKNYIFYEQSKLLVQLKNYPYIQFTVIGLFLIIAYVLFSISRKAEQDQVWVGMSKETAHQLGTPISSLMAWIEYLKTNEVDAGLLNEMNRDINRLQMITERFSKIGSQPTLQKEDLNYVLKNAFDYLKERTSKNIEYKVNLSQVSYSVLLSVPLFEWVIENITKNAIDAMDGKGQFIVNVTGLSNQVVIDLTDTGKGISKSNFKSVFKPGYTTKKRGWGLGLSLCKRIIEIYHKGQIFVLQSEEGKGTTFRIILQKA